MSGQPAEADRDQRRPASGWSPTSSARRGIADERVLARDGRASRASAFVPERDRAAAYADEALPIEAGQTISQPYIVARMTELLAVAARRPRPRDRHRAPATRRRSSRSSAAA